MINFFQLINAYFEKWDVIIGSLKARLCHTAVLVINSFGYNQFMTLTLKIQRENNTQSCHSLLSREL